MGLSNGQVYNWLPAGLSDNREALSASIGDCRTLQNLIHDPTSKGVLAPRAATVPLTDFTGFTTPGVVSLVFANGRYIYGLLATGRFPGFDEPFCYDTLNEVFVTVTGVTSSTVPASLPTSGNWIPPTAVLVGIDLVVSHLGFSGTNMFGWFDITNPAAPVWHSGNVTGGTTLPSQPIALGSFFNRCWFGMSNGLVYFSDILAATVITDAGQALQVGTTDTIVGFAPQPMTTGTQGILSALLIFKATSIWQVTGDFASTSFPLALNELTASVGTLANRSITATPSGTFFLANDGIRTVTLTGTVSEPQADVVYPFYNVNPASRACADYAADVYRISVTSVTNTGDLGKFDYWFSLRFSRWTGPHTFTYDEVVAYGNTFILASNDAPGMLWTSNPFPSSSDTFEELGVPMSVKLITSAISPQPPMAEKAAIEMEIAVIASVETYTVQVQDASGNAIAQTLLVSESPPASWGSGVWGVGFWNAAPYNLDTTQLNFPIPLVFKTCVVVLTGTSALFLRVGHFSFRYKGLGYSGSDT